MRIPKQLSKGKYGKDRYAELYVSVVGTSMVLIGDGGDLEEVTLNKSCPTFSGFMHKEIIQQLIGDIANGAVITVTTGTKTKMRFDNRTCGINAYDVTVQLIDVVAQDGGLRTRTTAIIRQDEYTELALIADAVSLS